MTRWLSLIQPDTAWPVRVFGVPKRGAPAELLGAIVAVGVTRPVVRFDDLLEGRAPAPVPPQVPAVWQLIAVTTASEVRGGGLGRRLAEFAVAALARESPRAMIQTLSPASGLAALMAALALTDAGHAASLVTGRLCDAAGRPWLAIQRFHQGNGASLDAIRPDSRADDRQSAAVTLCFGYPNHVDARARGRDAYAARVHEAARRVASARATPLPAVAGAFLVDEALETDR
ncbi:MAG: hypothetical protein R3F39_04490 [Myxococcota bacterium]